MVERGKNHYQYKILENENVSKCEHESKNLEAKNVLSFPSWCVPTYYLSIWKLEAGES